MTSLSKISFILTIFLLSSCSNIKRVNIEYIIYGTYAGECEGHCATMFKLEDTKLLVDTTDSFFDNHGKSITFRSDTLSRKEFIKAQAVKQQLPELLLQSSSKEFGSPDNHDQGGIFIELKSGLTTKRFYIDTDLDKIPRELREYAKLIMETTGLKTF
jgi:hypothetical protein